MTNWCRRNELIRMNVHGRRVWACRIDYVSFRMRLCFVVTEVKWANKNRILIMRHATHCHSIVYRVTLNVCEFVEKYRSKNETYAIIAEWSIHSAILRCKAVAVMSSRMETSLRPKWALATIRFIRYFSNRNSWPPMLFLYRVYCSTKAPYSGSNLTRFNRPK